MNVKMFGQLVRYLITLADLSVEISGTKGEMEFSPTPPDKQKKKKRLENSKFYATVKYVCLVQY